MKFYSVQKHFLFFIFILMLIKGFWNLHMKKPKWEKTEVGQPQTPTRIQVFWFLVQFS